MLTAIRPAYARRRPERTTLYRVVLENIETLNSASDEGALPFPLPHFVRKELDGYLDCGLLVRGFAHVQCEHCETSHLVAFSCKGRGFCPSCKGRRMAETAANLIEYVLPPAPLRQWVLTLPHAWRRRGRSSSAAVPPPRVHTVRYAGVLAARSKLRARIVPKPVVVATAAKWRTSRGPRAVVGIGAGASF